MKMPRIKGFVLLLLIAILCFPLLTITVWQRTRLLDVEAKRTDAKVNTLQTPTGDVFDAVLGSVKEESVQRVNYEYAMSIFEPRHVAEARVVDRVTGSLSLDNARDRPDQPLI